MGLTYDILNETIFCVIMSVVIMQEYNVMVNSEELIGTTEHLSL
jgi:hypothetical protein